MSQKSLSRLLRLLTAVVAAAMTVMAAVLVRYGRGLCLERGQEQLFVPCLIFFFLTLIAAACALILAWRIFASIGRDQSFTRDNARRLRTISWLACGDTLAYLLALPLLALVTRVQPFTVLVLLSIVFAGLCFTVACSCLSHLVQKAADLRQEQELTI